MTKVVVGMSGGVDSSVAALILKERGYDVIGVSMRLWGGMRPDEAGNTCCSCVDQQDAARVSAELGIRFIPVSLTGLFQERVVQPFVNEYIAGQTPSPCVLCNQHLKFGELARIAQSLGAGMIATGHYARIVEDADGTKHLFSATDKAKDQSYFLFTLDQERLLQTLFPLGGLSKDEVRSYARQFGLHTAAKPDSQGLCFVPGGDPGRFVEERLNGHRPPVGFFVDGRGRRLGTHRGIHHYTVGQRRGLGLAVGHRMYVCAIRPETHEIVLGRWEEALCPGFQVRGIHWIDGSLRGEELECEVRFRYRLRPVRACLVPEAGMRVQVRFAEPQRAVAPGQAAVFYQGDEVLGGGWIT